MTTLEDDLSLISDIAYESGDSDFIDAVARIKDKLLPPQDPAEGWKRIYLHCGGFR